MIKIHDKALKKLPKFWNSCVFHPTDAIEDPWGRRILDRMAKDGAISMVRIYSMFEDVVYLDEDGGLCYDFRLSDLRLDYLMEKGFDLLISYAGIPDCIASSLSSKTSVSKNKTRYKGKLWNAAPPRDYALWEEICYEYTKHNVERYGIETVAKWRCQCFNEPDINLFFLPELGENENANQVRLAEYCKLYEAFERGVRRVSERICIGGPAFGVHIAFLEGFLDHVKEKQLKLDFVSLHGYGTTPHALNNGSRPYAVSSLTDMFGKYIDTIYAHGFPQVTVLIDEWGMASAGFYNKEECPLLMARETEVCSAYFIKLIAEFIRLGFPVEMLAICLSGQHEMVEDFSGFRNFFTLNFIAKPIYNAHLMTSKIYDHLVLADCGNKNVFTIPTKNNEGDYAVLLTYSTENFEDDLPTITREMVFDDDISDKIVTVYCIDKVHTNPYRMWERAGKPDMTEERIKELRDEGKMKPVKVQSGSETLSLKLTSNCTYLITVTK